MHFRFFSLTLLILALSCGKAEKQAVPPTETTSTPERVFYPNFEIGSYMNDWSDKNEYWVVEDVLFGPKMKLNRINGWDKVPLEKWMFCRSSEGKTLLTRNNVPSCGMNMTIVDSLAWTETNDTIDIYTSMYTIGLNRVNVEKRYLYQREMLNKSQMILTKIQEL